MTALAADLTPAERALARDAAARALLQEREAPLDPGSLSHLSTLTAEEREIAREAGRRGGRPRKAKTPRPKTLAEQLAALERLTRRVPAPDPDFSARPAVAPPLAAAGPLPSSDLVLKLARAVHGAEVADGFDLDEHLLRVAETVARVTA